jgi:hypothetical protein
MRVEIKWMRKKKVYRVARVSDSGEIKMFTFYGAFSDAIKQAEYFYSFGDVK